MILRGYNIQLKRLIQADIEMVRHWRNSVDVSKHMEYREIITAEQQIKWFNSINNIYNYYFIILENNVPVGLVNGADADWENGISGNGGIFLSNPSYIDSDISVRAIFLILDASTLLGLHTQYAKVLRDNERAKFFNKRLGYQLMDGQDEVYNQKYCLTADRYNKMSPALKKGLGFSAAEKIELIIQDEKDPASQHFIRLYASAPAMTRERIQLIYETPR